VFAEPLRSSKKSSDKLSEPPAIILCCDSGSDTTLDPVLSLNSCLLSLPDCFEVSIRLDGVLKFFTFSE